MIQRPVPLVVHVIYRLDIGGLENGLVNLVNSMPATRYRHEIVCLAGFGEFRHRIQREDVHVRSLDKRPGKDPICYWRLWRLLRHLRPDIVHTRNLGTVDMQWAAWAAGVAHRIHGEHGWDASDPQGQSARSLRIRRMCRPVIRQYVAMSRDLAGWLEEGVGVPGRRIRQIYNGVDTTRFSPEGPLPAELPWPVTGTDRPIIVGTVGRLDPVKNQQALIDAFARLVERSSSVSRELRLVIVGDGPQRSELNVRVSRLGLDHLVWMPGSRTDVSALMRSLDVFALPSLNEGISNTILEAMATGLPVVAGNVGGNPELVLNGVTGTLYENRNPVGLEQVLLRYVQNEDLRRQHGAAARDRAVRHFSLQAMIDGYVALYDDVLGLRQREAGSGKREDQRKQASVTGNTEQ